MLFQGEHEFPFFYATDQQWLYSSFPYSLNADEQISSTGTQLFCCMSAEEESEGMLK
tara:strand:+ start:494 stop:664 length:171 start_codon:yes stop_codon:yes gene_type:complete